MAAGAALRVAAELPAEPGRRAAARRPGAATWAVFNDSWMAATGSAAGTRATVGDVLRRKDGSMPELVHAHPNETVADAVHYLREFHVSQMPVGARRAAGVAAEVAGAWSSAICGRLFTGRAQLSDRREKHMSAPCPHSAAGEPLDEAMSAFAEADAALVLVDGKPAGWSPLRRTRFLGPERTRAVYPAGSSTNASTPARSRTRTRCGDPPDHPVLHLHPGRRGRGPGRRLRVLA